MSEKPKSSGRASSGMIGLVVRALRFVAGPGRRGVTLVVLFAATAGGIYALWQHVGRNVVVGESYRLDYDDILTTPQPEWIRADVKREALREASLDDTQSIFDDARAKIPLTQRIAQAFKAHPWVADVTRVDKFHPARVEVQLVYRRPVCMVEVPGGLIPVDVNGVVLPMGDFTLNKHWQYDALRYPRLASIGSMPVGLTVGKAWTDPRLLGAAKLAALLQDDWERLQLTRIVTVITGQSEGLSAPQFEVYAAKGTRIVWGHAPGAESSGEPEGQEKLKRLAAFAAQQGSLEAPQGVREIDLRPARTLSERIDTAAVPEETETQ